MFHRQIESTSLMKRLTFCGLMLSHLFIKNDKINDNSLHVWIRNWFYILLLSLLKVNSNAHHDTIAVYNISFFYYLFLFLLNAIISINILVVDVLVVVIFGWCYGLILKFNSLIKNGEKRDKIKIAATAFHFVSN